MTPSFFAMTVAIARGVTSILADGVVRRAIDAPYASDDYRNALMHAGMVASVSRKGGCWDNAVAESFFSTLETEALGQRIPDRRETATRLVAK